MSNRGEAEARSDADVKEGSLSSRVLGDEGADDLVNWMVTVEATRSDVNEIGQQEGRAGTTATTTEFPPEEGDGKVENWFSTANLSRIRGSGHCPR